MAVAHRITFTAIVSRIDSYEWLHVPVAMQMHMYVPTHVDTLCVRESVYCWPTVVFIPA